VKLRFDEHFSDFKLKVPLIAEELGLPQKTRTHSDAPRQRQLDGAYKSLTADF